MYYNNLYSNVIMNKQRMNLNLVYAISFVDLFAVGLTIPLLDNRLRELGSSHFTVGLIKSLHSGLQVISGPIIGSWSDVRDRKSVLRIILLISGICYVLLGCTDSIFLIGILRFLLGITEHTQSICKAIVTDILPTHERAGAYGKSISFGSLGYIIGTLFGGYLSEVNYLYVCFLTTAIFIMNIGLCTALSNESRRKTQTNQKVVLSGIKQEFLKSITNFTAIDWMILRDTFLLKFIFELSIRMYFCQESTYLRENFNLSRRHIGYTVSYFNAIGLASGFLLDYTKEYLYKADESCFRRVRHFFSLMAASFIGLAVAPNIQLFLVILVPFSLSNTVLKISSMELMLKEASQEKRGFLAGISRSIMSLAKFVTPMSSGLIIDKLGGQIALLISALFPLIGTAVATRLVRNPETKNY